MPAEAIGVGKRPRQIRYFARTTELFYSPLSTVIRLQSGSQRAVIDVR
jgi:hypothetical protein